MCTNCTSNYEHIFGYKHGILTQFSVFIAMQLLKGISVMQFTDFANLKEIDTYR